MADEKIQCPQCGSQIDAEENLGRSGRYRCPFCWYEFERKIKTDSTEQRGEINPDELKSLFTGEEAPEKQSGSDDLLIFEDASEEDLEYKSVTEIKADKQPDWLQEKTGYVDYPKDPPKPKQKKWQDTVVNCPNCRALMGVGAPDIYLCRSCGHQFRYPEDVEFDLRGHKKDGDEESAVEIESIPVRRLDQPKTNFSGSLFEEEDLFEAPKLGTAFWTMIFNPVIFFRRLDPNTTIKFALIFATMFIALGSAIGGMLAYAGIGPASKVAQLPANFFLFGLFCSLVMIPLGLIIWAAMIHIFVLITGGGGGYKSTLMAICFASGVQVFEVIPYIGWLAGIWTLLLTIVGLKELHGTSYFRAVTAVILPFIVLIVSTLILMATLAPLAGNPAAF